MIQIVYIVYCEGEKGASGLGYNYLNDLYYINSLLKCYGSKYEGGFERFAVSRR
jgi:hypothetical protein